MFAILKGRGGAGRSFSRQETVERFNPLIQKHNELMYAYNAAITSLEDRDAAKKLDLLQSTSRVDIAKLSETIVSNAGTPPLGTELQGSRIDLGADDRAILDALEKREKAYNDALKQNAGLRHHVRSLAIINNALKNSDTRLKTISQVAGNLKKPVTAS